MPAAHPQANLGFEYMFSETKIYGSERKPISSFTFCEEECSGKSSSTSFFSN
jgi:hypothetical protein